MPLNEATSSSQPQLPDQILAALEKQPDQKASELATALGVSRQEINRRLTHALAGLVVQDAAYRWRLRNQVTSSTGAVTGQATPVTELARLCRYCLDCIGQDLDTGVSVFAASKYGAPDYAELPDLPMAGAAGNWWNAPGVERVLSRVKAERNKLTAWLGFPVRLREHRTSNWHGFFVEPVLLWSIELPEKPGDPYRIVDDLPVPNFAVLRSVAMGDVAAVVAEAARLDEELGLNSPIESRPEVDEVIDRLVSIRPDWDWRETIDPTGCSGGVALSEIALPGIYNRAVILPSERSPYTQGLEAELKKLGELNEGTLLGTALGRWLSGQAEDAVARDEQPLIEVLPMNAEQRMAVKSALVSPHTVVTGPPGTGKSQVVTNLLVNAAWRGMKVLFASKNNKAVDVVEARVNGLGNRPVLLRLGSNEYQAKLASYMTAMLSGHVGQDDEVSYQEGLTRHRQLTDMNSRLDRDQQQTLEARNQVDRLEQEIDGWRDGFGPERFNNLDEDILATGEGLLPPFLVAIDATDPGKLGFLGRLLLWFSQSSRLKALHKTGEALSPLTTHLGLDRPAIMEKPDLARLRTWAAELSERLKAARKVLAYQQSLDVLCTSLSFEEIARQRQHLTQQVAENSSRLWRDWVQLTPSRLAPAQRRDIADYTVLLQVLTGKDSDKINSAMRSRARELQAKVSSLFSCWAVTSLSARGKVPFEPGHFDLVVIDEASQCDIASALPLLFRAKRSVIIGDPMQLRHISAVTHYKDADLLSKYGLVEKRTSWMYSVNSLYDVAAAVADASNIINLRDHHRSHADIIEFSNQTFYENKLRVATRYAKLKRPRSQEKGVIWQDVKGKTLRPHNGGAENPAEAKALVDALRDLLIARQYEGTVGVVTPFRAQAQLIQTMLNKQSDMADVAARCELLVDTVHKFQGDERDVMFFSPVVSEGVTPGALGFLRSNGNLFNVAITRARGLLHVVGDRHAAAGSGVDYLANFAAYVSRLDTSRPPKVDEQMRDLGTNYPTVARPEQVSDWERLFYRALYAAGVRSIPQFTVEQYDLDFAVIAGNKKLNIEVDGERYHRSWTGELCLRDQLRNQRMIELGWEVKRFWVYEIRDRLPECVEWVRAWSLQAGDESETLPESK